MYEKFSNMEIGKKVSAVFGMVTANNINNNNNNVANMSSKK